MFQNYLLTAWRNLLKNKLYSAINIAGLAIGLAACLLILLFVEHELSYNSWLPGAERIYKVHSRYDVPGREPMFFEGAPGPAAPALAKDFPQIEAITRLLLRAPTVRQGDRVFREEMALVDAGFFAVFDLALVAGDRTSALADTSSVVLSQSLARKYFGTADPIGQVLTMDDNVRKRDFRVTGVFADLPGNTTFDFGMIGLFDAAEYVSRPYMAEEWTSPNAYTYFKLHAAAKIAALAEALPEFERRNVPDDIVGGEVLKSSELLELSVRPVGELRLFGRPFEKGGGDVATVLTFAAVAVMILLIACMNFVNLATARASQRAREVALRKVLGAQRRQLVLQFLAESVLLALIGLFIAVALVQLALPAYGAFLDKDLTLSLFGAGSILPSAAALVMIIGIAGGLYPALYLSAFRPVRTLKANKSSGTGGSVRTRSILVVAQFAISIALIVCTGVVYAQARYAKTKELGFTRDGMLVVRGIGMDDARAASRTLAEEIAKLPGVSGVGRSSYVPGDAGNVNSSLQVAGAEGPQAVFLGRLEVDGDFFDTYGIRLVAGRDFDAAKGDDSSGIGPDNPRTTSLMVNESAVRKLGLGTPEETVGHDVTVEIGKAQVTARIVGVVADFHYKSIHEPIRPSFYLWDDQAFGSLSVRFSGVSGAELMGRIEALWRRLVPNRPFRADFLDQRLAEQYAREDAQAVIFAAFSGLAIFVACLGLYGLASFTATHRTKEIGIRKVMGAKVGDIVGLMVWQFSKPVLVANLIAWPLAYLAMRDWLAAFEYRIELSPAFFIAGGLAALAVAWITVAGHAVRIARSNPARALRYE